MQTHTTTAKTNVEADADARYPLCRLRTRRRRRAPKHVGRTQEQHEVSILQKLVGADLREQLQRVVDAIGPWILFEVLEQPCSATEHTNNGEAAHLIKCADGSHEDNSITEGLP